jgi:3-methyladenine DNA glycosylase AlkC
LAEAFKLLLHERGIVQAASLLQRQLPGFDRPRFMRQATQGLAALEMKARAMQIADALEATLPARFADAADAIEAALAPAESGDAMAQLASHDSGPQAGLRGWILWPVGEFVARRGQAEPERALQCLHALTQRFTAEWAIRPFIQTHPDLSWATLARWTRDPSHHVRRLVSEGSRPRLPWGQQLKGLIADPQPTLPLLRALQDDPSDYVRRSVANHLNDIAKDHPVLVVDWLQQHLKGASPERAALLRHAARTLVKDGHPGALKALGLGSAFKGEALFQLAPRRIELGEAVQLTLDLSSLAKQPQRLVVDYAVHHVKADGASSAKVFKGWQLTLAAGEKRRLTKQHAVKPITTRRYWPGWHRVTVQVNGKDVAEAGFELRL